MEPQPVINVEEFIDKTVGRHLPARDPLLVSDSGKAGAQASRAALPYLRVPRGVYRFKTHEEADAWMTKHTGVKKL